MKEPNDIYKLCYVDGNIMYFTDNFENQRGDDWDDAPYEYNAEEPYDRKYYKEYDDEWCKKHGCGNIRCIAYLGDAREACDYGWLSVDEINKGGVPWLYNDVAGELKAGTTIGDAQRWLHKAGMLWGELEDGKKDFAIFISCPKCHGMGKYEVPMFDDETYMPSETEWESRHCELCYGTGKVTVEFYESIQKASRDK